MPRRAPVLLLLTGLLLGLGASPASRADDLPPVDAIPPALLTPDRLGDTTLALLWTESVEAELEGRTLESAALRREILSRRPDDVHTGWRLARDLVALGEALPEDARARRLELFHEARSVASGARRADPHCSECCFYEFASTARIATTRGAFRSLNLVRRSGDLLAACLAMPPPVWTDTAWNHERANLYYGAAVYFRMLPDTWWTERLLGVRGDRRKAASFARRAFDVAPDRVDYRVELGVALVCLEQRDGDDAAGREGRARLRDLDALPDRLRSDPQDRERARLVLAHPEQACENARALKLE